MVIGVEKFREFFKDHGDQYALIGGAACDLLFARAGLDFRATKDIDMVICVEVISADFAKRFADFIAAAGYQATAMSDGEKKFFRFSKPKDASFPAMIELFGRPGATVEIPGSDKYVRLTVEEEIVSLSALLLDKDYFAAVQAGRTTVDGLSVLDEKLLIPFKARAYLDLSARKEKGEKVDAQDIKKHCNDIFRLAQLLPAEGAERVDKALQDDLRRFIAAIDAVEIEPKKFGVDLTKAAGIATLKRFYEL